MVKETTGWQTDDGQFFRSWSEAVDHEAFEKLKQFCEDAGLDDQVNDEDIVMVLWRHRNRVKEILAETSNPSELEKLST